MTVGLQVSNFATLRQASVSLNRLLVLMGPNNSGKSTAAVLLYAACRSAPLARPGSHAYGPHMPYISAEFDRRHFRGAVRELQGVARSSKTAEELAGNFPQAVRDIMVRPIRHLLDSYVRAFGKQLERCFGATLKELVRKPSGGQPLRVEISHGDEWAVTVSVVKGRAFYEHDFGEISDDGWHEIVKSFLGELASWAGVRAIRTDVDVAEYLLHDLFSHVARFYFRHFPSAAHYLPASRSGALQSHRALAAALVRQSTYAGIEEVAVPKLPGVVADFIGQLLELDPRRHGPYQSVAARLQQVVLHGEIELSAQASAAPEISYASAGAKYALHRTSSMVSELAPIVLFLRHVVDRGDLLIIEEPESHLHPFAQVNFATTLAQLVSSGIYVMVTTHSDYFVNQISNLIMAESIKSKRGSSVGRADVDATIRHDVAGAYLFVPDPSGSGSDVQDLPVSAEGISDAEFAQVAEWLYNKGASLAQEMNVTDA